MNLDLKKNLPWFGAIAAGIIGIVLLFRYLQQRNAANAAAAEAQAEAQQQAAMTAPTIGGALSSIQSLVPPISTTPVASPSVNGTPSSPATGTPISPSGLPIGGTIVQQLQALYNANPGDPHAADWLREIASLETANPTQQIIPPQPNPGLQPAPPGAPPPSPPPPPPPQPSPNPAYHPLIIDYPLGGTPLINGGVAPNPPTGITR